MGDNELVHLLEAFGKQELLGNRAPLFRLVVVLHGLCTHKSLSLSLYIYIYMYSLTNVYTHMYIYIHI